MLRPRAIVFLACLGLGVFVALRLRDQEQDAPLAFHRATIETARTGDATALWYALPASYQSDIEACVQSFADKLDGYEDIYDRTFVLIGKLGRLLAEKKEFFLASAELERFVHNQTAVSKVLEPGSRVLRDLSTSPVGTAENVKKLDLPEDLSGDGSSFARDALELIRVLSQAVPERSPLVAAVSTANLGQIGAVESRELFIEDVSESSATVRIEVSGQEPVRQIVVLVEGKWIPETIAIRWREMIARIQTGLTELAFTEKEKFFVSAMLNNAEQAIESLNAVETQAQFDRQLGQILSLVGQL